MRVYPILLLPFLIGACTPRLVSLPDPTQVTATSHVQAPTLPHQTAAPDEIAGFAVTDLSTRLSRDPEEVHVLSVEMQLWPDASLGCPRLQEVYDQKAVPGYRIFLEVDGRNFVYHTDAVDKVVLCIEDELPSFPVTPGEIDDGQPWMPVD